MIYFTADTHFGHANIVRMCERPYPDVDTMNEAMIAAWNERVHGNDTVYIVGDMFLRCADPERILKRLKGKKRLIVGNHDGSWMGKDISVRPPGRERFVRLARNFGEEYTLDGIRNRILSQSRRVLPELEPKRKVYCARVKGDFNTARKITGFRALYFHYCYLLGIFPKNQPKSNKRLRFLLREDLVKLDTISEEVRLLARDHIDTTEQS